VNKTFTPRIFVCHFPYSEQFSPFAPSVDDTRGSHCNVNRLEAYDLFVIPLNSSDLLPVTGLPSFGRVIYNVTVPIRYTGCFSNASTKKTDNR
jgi:hypothetical protein